MFVFAPIGTYSPFLCSLLQSHLLGTASTARGAIVGESPESTSSAIGFEIEEDDRGFTATTATTRFHECAQCAQEPRQQQQQQR